MKTLPNGAKIYNATPHEITFWQDDWPEPVTVSPDEIINAKPVEKLAYEENGVDYVRTVFERSDDGMAIVSRIAHEHPTNTIIVGSIIAAQAYAGIVVSMVPHPDYMRVPPAEKRMLPNKFNIF